MEEVTLIINGIEVRANVTKQFIKDNKEETKMYKTILKKVGMYLIEMGFNFIYNAIDKDKDGKLSKKELDAFAKLIIKKVKKK